MHLAKTEGIEGFEKYLAIKIVHPRLAEDEEIIGSLIREAKIAVQLNHVNIGQIFDLGKISDRYYVSMEYIDGYDLFKIMSTAAEKDIHVPFDVAAFIAHEVCAALHYAHNRVDRKGRALHLIHRDVSPQNIMVSHQGEVKLVDFGIAKVSDQISRTQTAIGVIKGKFYYMSPEQASAQKLDSRSDIYSLGICNYEMIAGHMLYHDENGPNDAVTILEKIRRSKIPPLRLSRPDCPPEFEQIVLKSLQRDVAKRYQSAREYQLDLTRFLFQKYPSFNRMVVADFMQKLFSETTTAPTTRPEVKSEERRTYGSNSASALMSRNEYAPTDSSVIFKLGDLPGTSMDVPQGGARVVDKQELRTELFTAGAAGLKEQRPGLSQKRNDFKALANELPTRIVDEESVRDFAVDLGGLDPSSMDGDEAPKTIVDPRYVGSDDVEFRDFDLDISTSSTGADSQELEVDLDALLAKVDEKLAPAELPTAILDPNDTATKIFGTNGPPKPIIPSSKAPSGPGSGPRSVVEQRPTQLVASTSNPSVEAPHLSRHQVAPSRVSTPAMPMPMPGPSLLSDSKLIFKLVVAGTAFLAIVCALLVWHIYFRGRGEAKTGRVTIHSTPSEATLFVNGEKQTETTPLKLELTPGKYRLTFAKEGFKQLNEILVIEADGDTTMRVKLTPVPGKIYITSEPKGAEVWVKGTFQGRTPWVLDNIQRGERLTILLKKDGFYNALRSVTLGLQKTSDRIHVKLEKGN
ncbi:MAG: serine/threonine protein kinase [Myxococcales bacterium]|nr:serine/threonine protein kinase [Myxococcales bacterium]